MKKKNYLDKAEKGVILGTSVLLLNGLMSCSVQPMDTPPTGTAITKGPGGPVGPPGAIIPWFEPYETPEIGENMKFGFIMTEKRLSFATELPSWCDEMEITINENQPDFIRYINKVTCGSAPNLRWRNGTGPSIILSGLKNTSSPTSRFIGISIYSVVTNPITLSFKFIR